MQRQSPRAQRETAGRGKNAKPQRNIHYLKDAKPASNKRAGKRRRGASAAPVRVRWVMRDTGRFRLSFYVIFTLVLIFLGGLGTAASYAYIGDMRLQINAAREALQTQKDSNAALRAEITQKYTLDEVERIAVERLGMNKPDASQIIYINVPKQSFVVLNDEETSPETETLWQQIIAYIKAWL